jgi:predicted nucleic acid-binding protein
VITAIDTNVLIDVFGADPSFGKCSAAAIRQCMQEGSIYACEVVWAETATAFPTQSAFEKAIDTLNIEFSSITSETALIAANAWKKYRQAGGRRERMVADFLIGAHALNQCERLLTRDRGFYRKYFSKLHIIDSADVEVAI